MRRLKKKIYLGTCGTALALLSVVRACNPEVMAPARAEQDAEEVIVELPSQEDAQSVQPEGTLAKARTHNRRHPSPPTIPSGAYTATTSASPTFKTFR